MELNEPFAILAALCALTMGVGMPCLLVLGMRFLKAIERLTSELAAVKSPDAAWVRGQTAVAVEAARNPQPPAAPEYDPFAGAEPYLPD